MLPKPHKLQASERTKDQFAIVSKLLNQSYDCVINACDAGREGEHIFRCVYTLSGSTLPIKRLWIASLTDEAITDGMNRLQDGAAFDHLADAARARSEADWLVGMNGSRALTLAVRAKNPGIKTPVFSVGRVQTPTLALLVKRHRDIEAFVPQTYFECHGTFEKDQMGFVGKLIDEHNQIKRFEDARLLDQYIHSLSGHPAHIQKVVTKQSKRTPPQLFDLTSLQRKANTDLNFSAQKTLDVAQALYERHKVLSYPRTDSKHITEDLAETLPSRVMAIAQSFDVAMSLTFDSHDLPMRIVDATQVTDHHAILVTENVPTDDLNKDERALYEMVARRCMAALATDVISSTTTVYTHVGEAVFISKGTQILDEGYLKYEPAKSKKDKDQLPSSLVEGQYWQVGSIKRQKCTTKPPKKLNEASLLLAMETAGKSLEDTELKSVMKGNGLGTPATRASTIETLLKRKYIMREGKALVPTDLGLKCIGALAGFEALTSAQMTAKWEKALAQVAQGIVDYDKFMTGIETYASAMVDHFKTKGVQMIVEGEAFAKPLGICPECDSDVYLYEKTAKCSKCRFILWRTVSKKVLGEKHMLDLLVHKRTQTIEGFTSKKNKPFSAVLVLLKTDDGYTTRFEFGGPQ